MYSLKIMLGIAIFSLFAYTSNAQPHYNAWFRGTLSIPVHSKVKTDAEFQHRRQNGFENDNMLHKPLMHSFRTWIHYQYNNALRFSVSPFACFSNNGIIQQKEDEWSLPNHEIRFTAAIESQKPLLNKLHYMIRPAIEYRWFRERNNQISRLRNKVGLKYEIGKNLNVLVYNELLLNVTGVSKAHFFDHNRLGMIIEYKMTRNIKADFGYMYIHRLPLHNSYVLNENNFMINISYEMKKSMLRF
jgi:hypothetical protein